jgi:hypothetical protein
MRPGLHLTTTCGRETAVVVTLTGPRARVALVRVCRLASAVSAWRKGGTAGRRGSIIIIVPACHRWECLEEGGHGGAGRGDSQSSIIMRVHAPCRRASRSLLPSSSPPQQACNGPSTARREPLPPVPPSLPHATRLSRGDDSRCVRFLGLQQGGNKPPPTHRVPRRSRVRGRRSTCAERGQSPAPGRKLRLHSRERGVRAGFACRRWAST